MENLLINRTVGGGKRNSDQDSAQRNTCLQFRYNSGWSHNVYCIININTCFWGTSAQLPKELIISEHVKVFYYISVGRTFLRCSLFTVWNNQTSGKDNFKQPAPCVWRFKSEAERSQRFAVRKLAGEWPWMSKMQECQGLKSFFREHSRKKKKK